jgi:uncharacterized protein (DUF2147 family)
MFTGVYMKSLKLIIMTIAAIMCITSISSALAIDISGKWQTMDKVTNKPASIITINKNGDTYRGYISKIFTENNHKTSDKCINCKGRLHNKPMLNMQILHVLLDPTGKIKKCMILDPQIGKVYHCKLKLANNNNTLELHGYIGVPLIGRTEEWQRAGTQ